MLHGENLDGVTEIMEADAKIADAEAELGRFDVLEPLDIAFASGDETGQCVEDAECCGLIDSAEELSLTLFRPGDLFGHRYRSSGGNGVVPMRSKSSGLRPNSASTSSLGMPSPGCCSIQAFDAETA